MSRGRGRPPKQQQSTETPTSTQEDVKQPHPDQPEPELDDRHSSAIEEMVARRKLEIDSEANFEGVDVVGNEPEPEPTTEDQEGEGDASVAEALPPTAAPPQASSPPTEPQATEFVTVKIDGETRNIPYAQFKQELAEYQKHGAAERRLQEAARLKREAEELASPSQKADLSALRAKYIKAFQYGTEAEADVALQEYENAKGLQNQHIPDEQTILEKATEAVEFRLALKEREKTWEKDNNDIKSDPMAYELVLTRMRSRIAEEPEKDAFTIATEEAQKIREWMASKGSSTQGNQPPNSLAEKARLKAEKTSTLPVAGGTMPQPDPPRPKTQSEIIAEMRAAREGVEIRRR